MEVYLNEVNLYGLYMYSVMVDEIKLDKFFTNTPLTWEDSAGIARNYREAMEYLEGYTGSKLLRWNF